jgi:hypothetical protein
MGESDREMLELAAKAAGFEPLRFDVDLDGLLLRGVQEPWNPLRDDGDALRLAVKLCMQIECSKGYQYASVYGHAWQVSERHDGFDPYAATRRAIVRAAASLASKEPTP